MRSSSVLLTVSLVSIWLLVPKARWTSNLRALDCSDHRTRYSRPTEVETLNGVPANLYERVKCSSAR